VNPGAEHWAAHLPSLQMRALPRHAFPHMPQFASFDARSTHVPGPPKRPVHCV
jgi:hypothetical protein